MDRRRKENLALDGAFFGRLIEYLANPAALKKNYIVVTTLIQECMDVIARDPGQFESLKKNVLARLKSISYSIAQ